ncbi:hypothetical protein [Anaerotignum sp.]|uniref:hypothetical protein n=1 Tax=Anaerotignum sp. TaxID=2039241 RepID=UPI0028B16065|nr:hypothetical protein [Anaerotignum sp.]
MSKKHTFKDFLIEHNDELDNAAHELALMMLSTDGMSPSKEELPWTMEIIGSILEHTGSILKSKGYHICWPYYGDDDTPCYVLHDCNHKNCPFKQQ